MDGTAAAETTSRPTVARAVQAPHARSPGGRTYQLTLIDSFQIKEHGRPLVVPASTQHLIARLALQGPSGRARLADFLRPEATEMRALACLRTALWRANQAAPGLLHVAGDTIRLTDDLDVDVTQVLRVSHRVLGGRVLPGDLDLLVDEGEVLPDWDDDWLDPDRERLRQLRLHVLEVLATNLTSEGDFGSAMEAALASLRTDPLRESAHRAVIRVHVAEGNLVAARRALDDCAAVLARELGVAPSPATYEALTPARAAAAGRPGSS